MKGSLVKLSTLNRGQVWAKVFQQRKPIYADLTDGTQLIAREPHQIGCFATLSGRHEQVVCVAKGHERGLDRDVRMKCLKGLDGGQEDVLFLALGRKGMPHGEGDGAVVVHRGGG